MAVSYTSKLTSDMLLNEVVTLLDWERNIVREAITLHKNNTPPEPSSDFVNWCKQQGAEAGLSDQIVDRLDALYRAIAFRAQELDKAAAKGEAFPVVAFDQFSKAVFDYVRLLQQIESETRRLGETIDPLTQLRTPSGLLSDLRREIERKNRACAAFSICAIEIDNMKQLKEACSAADVDKIIAFVASQLAGPIRSFDDAYYYGDGKFLMVLKQAEPLDACSVMERIRDEIAVKKNALSGGGGINVTVSFGVAESDDEGVTVEDITVHAYSALERAQAAGGNRIEQYRESSRLSQFAQKILVD